LTGTGAVTKLISKSLSGAITTLAGALVAVYTSGSAVILGIATLIDHLIDRAIPANTTPDVAGLNDQAREAASVEDDPL
jgi:hypothetical protein